ncbi:transglycosylase SLT domain-containing protein, partial [Candidatus Poribacteria bacterium]|nr:transglycosylase SLT domain-containing protein [Candidatus Poribacteria bacterium]
VEPTIKEAYPKIKEENVYKEIGKIKEPIHKKVPEVTDMEMVLEKYSKLYKVDLPLVMALIKVESEFNPQAISPAGAMGLMQLMPETARNLGLVVDGPIDERLNPVKNLEAGIQYLRSLMDTFDNPIDAIAAYNVGPKVIHKGLPTNAETLQHVYKVLRQKYIYENSAELMYCDINDMTKNCEEPNKTIKSLTQVVPVINKTM